MASSDDSDAEDIIPQLAEDENASLPALFWDTIPENAQDHPDYVALKAIEEESTPEERAESFKVSSRGQLCSCPSWQGFSTLHAYTYVALMCSGCSYLLDAVQHHVLASVLHQVQGNNKLKVGLKAKNRLLLREAIDFYNKALALKCSDTALNVALHNNKAHVNSLLGEEALC
jgi:hypothetical protein